MELVQRLSAQAEQFEIVTVESESTTVGFEANKLKSSRVEKTKGVAVRVVKDGRLGFAASSAVLDAEAAVQKLERNALESAAYGDRLPIRFPGPQSAPDVLTFDRAITDLSVARLAEIGQGISQLLFPGRLMFTPYVSFAPPVNIETLRSESSEEDVLPAVIARTKALLAEHCRVFGGYSDS